MCAGPVPVADAHRGPPLLRAVVTVEGLTDPRIRRNMMAENGDKTRDGLEIVDSLTVDDSSEQEVESVWRQLRV